MCIREDKRVIFIKSKGNEILAYGKFVRGDGELENNPRLESNLKLDSESKSY